MKIIVSFFYKVFLQISDRLKEILKKYHDPSIDSFSPHAAYSGSVIDIEGYNFGALREDNEVTIGGISARVIEASETRLKIISAVETITGKIRVKVGGKTGTSINDFSVKPYPSPGSEDDGPPILYQGVGFPFEGDLLSKGTLRILVCLVNPTDRVPANPVNERNTVVAAWNNVSTFYNQVSYGALTVQIDFFTNWQTLSGNYNDYIDTGISNIRQGVLSRLMAEAASFAEGAEGFALNDYQMIACVINLNSTVESIRAWGGSSTNNFRYDDLSINITTTNPISELWVETSSDWGRLAHETGHNIISSPFVITGDRSFGARTLGENIYDSDLVDSSVASAQNFDMMGNHNSHPMFSAYHMEKTGWYNVANIRELVWDRNEFSQEFEIIAHGTVQDTTANRYHLVKIKVGSGLFYYIEVRQKPAAAAYIFDTNIPVSNGDGGVVVTKVVTETVNNNQQMRLISLLHSDNVLRLNDTAEDPGRTLKITVINDNVAARPLVCRVKIEWTQNISTSWVPVVGEHTFLKVFVSQQTGEISGGNNAARENVFNFEAPAASAPEAVYIPLAVRNPTAERMMIRMSVTGIKVGYIVQFPHEWVWLDPLEERKFYLTVVPYFDYPVYKAISKRYKQKGDDYASNVLVTGYLPKSYKKELEGTGFPASRLEKIGGVFSNVKPKNKVKIEFYQERKENRAFQLSFSGMIVPKLPDQAIHVELQSPLFDTDIHTAKTGGKGQFSVSYDLKVIADNLIKMNKIKDYNDFVNKANLTAQAFVFDAEEAAEAESDKISVILNFN